MGKYLIHQRLISHQIHPVR